MIQVIRTIDDPEANGRTPIPGDVRYRFTFPHENGDDYLEIHTGKKGVMAMHCMIRELQRDDESDTDPACFI